MIKHLLISLFCFTTFVAAQTNITGAWLTDWQNSPLVCSPFGFNITQTVINETTTNTTIDYFFSADTILHNCPLSTRNYSSPLVLNQSTNIWQDNTSQQIIYNQVADTVAYLLPATALQSQNLYDRTGSYLINGKVGSILGGHWTNPTPVSANDNCPCVPYLVGAYPSGFSSFNVSAYLYYNSTTCSNGQASFDSGLYQPDPVNITWQFNSTNLTQPKFSLNTNSTPALLTLTINPGNNTCVYSYTKSQDGFVSGQWSLDWQTPNIENFPKLLSIGIFSQGFMKGIFTFKNNTAKNDFFVLNGPSQSSYATYNLEYNFYYDSTQNTFSASTQDNSILYYTPNGSYFSQGAFTQNWTNPTTESNTQISPNDCCYPDTIVITGDPFNNSLLLANYTYSQDSLKSEWCTDISKYLNSSNVTETSLHIVAPSFTRLIWEDEIGYTLELLTPPSWSNITLNYQNDLGDQCLFNMQVASPNPPGPNPPNPNPPKGANLISSGLAFLLVILAAYL